MVDNLLTWWRNCSAEHGADKRIDCTRTRMANLLKGTIYSREELTQVTATLRSLADDLEGICNGIGPSTPDTSVEEWFFGRKALPCLVGKIEGHARHRSGSRWQPRRCC